MDDALTKVYYLQEVLREVREHDSTDKAADVLPDRVKQINETEAKQLVRMANTQISFRSGTPASYDKRISNAKIEAINNKIKMMKRIVCGFRDDDLSQA